MNVLITNKVLGKGAFGTVYLGLKKDAREIMYAVKQMDRGRLKSKRENERIISEIKILKEIKSQNVVGLIQAALTSNSYYLAMELCNGGDLDNFRIKRGKGYLVEREARLIIK